MSVRDAFERMDYGPAPEGAEVALEWLEQRGGSLKHYINGSWEASVNKAYFETNNPVNSDPFGKRRRWRKR